jgi:tetratricopeptide (TPR) repeat protein
MAKNQEKKEEKKSSLNIPILNAKQSKKIDHLYSKYKKPISYGLYALIALVLIVYYYKNFYLKNKELSAREQIYTAQNYFRIDSFELALYGTDEGSYGFLDVIDEFGATQTGNLAKYYAGLCFLHMGAFEDALVYLKKFKTDSEILKPLSLGAIADAYSELEDYSKAASYYMKAAKSKDNEFTSPHFYLKAGMVFEYLEEYEKALDTYTIIKEKYPRTQEGNKIDKYLGRVQAKMGEI